MLATVPRLEAKFIVMNMFYCRTSMFYVVMSWLLKSFLDTKKINCCFNDSFRQS